LRVFYVDDSGDEDMPDHCRGHFSSWALAGRAQVTTYQLPVDFEIHAQEFVSDHGQTLRPDVFACDAGDAPQKTHERPLVPVMRDG
jgi:hypothetical protein